MTPPVKALKWRFMKFSLARLKRYKDAIFVNWEKRGQGIKPITKGRRSDFAPLEKGVGHKTSGHSLKNSGLPQKTLRPLVFQAGYGPAGE